MKVKEFQKILTSAINLFSKYKPSDLIICDTGETYQENYWRCHPYLTIEKFGEDSETSVICGIKISQKSRGEPNKVLIKDEIVNEIPSPTIEIREIKRLLTTALHTLDTFDAEAEMDFTYRPRDAEKPFIAVYDRIDEDFQFMSLNHLGVKAETIELESKQVPFEQLKKIVCESKNPEREIFECAEIAIEELYRDGDPDFDDEQIYRIVSGRKAPNYRKIIDKMLSEEYASMLSTEATELVYNYQANSIIMDAMNMFASGLSYDY